MRRPLKHIPNYFPCSRSSSGSALADEEAIETFFRLEQADNHPTGSALADEEAIETIRVRLMPISGPQAGSALADEEAIETHCLFVASTLRRPAGSALADEEAIETSYPLGRDQSPVPAVPWPMRRPLKLAE